MKKITKRNTDKSATSERGSDTMLCWPGCFLKDNNSCLAFAKAFRCTD